MNAIISATRRRLEQARREDSGFALIFVLFVTTVVMIGTASMLTVTVSGIAPARQNQDTAAALAAAQSGVQAYLAMLDANCAPTSIATCSWLTATQKSTPLTGTIGTQRYSTKAVNYTGYVNHGNNGTLRLVSTGSSPVGGATTVSRTLTVDLSGQPNPLRFTYFSNYETLGTSFLNSYFGARKITLTDSAAAGAVGLSAGTTVTWDGAGAARADALTDGLCDKLYYDDASNGTDPSGRATLKTSRTSLLPGTDYAESGRTQSAAQLAAGTTSAVTRYAPCELTFTKGENFSGPVYSRDAFYLSNGDFGNATGPRFGVPAAETLPALWTGWQPGNVPGPTDATKPYRSFPVIGGVPDTAPEKISSSPFDGLSLPTTTGITTGTCTFTGPTKITLAGTNATVTSPLTTDPGSSCPATLNASKVAVVPITTTTIYVANAANATSLGFLNLPGTDITNYSATKGDAYVQGTLTGGRLSVVTEDDIVATGDILAGHAAANDGNQPAVVDANNGERSWASGSAAIDLVATNNVRVYHPVRCDFGSAAYGASGAPAPATDTTNGYCANDISGLYTSAQANAVIKSDGSLRSTHPSLQYDNLTGSSATHEIDAAVFALNGSFLADNFDRGTSLGNLLVSGGVYQNHHGVVGEQWTTPNAASSRANSGYKLQINYLNYSNAGLGYVPELVGGDVKHPWQIVSVSSGGT